MSDINYPKAIKTLSALTDGVDPQTGELLVRDHVLNQPGVIRSLSVALETLRAKHRRQLWQKKLPHRAGEKWSRKESNKLRIEFKDGKSTKQIAEKHQRTSGAIRSRLAKLGLL